MLAGGKMEPSDSPWSAPVVLVTKKDGGTRLCVDYHRLNIVTVKDAYPLPRIDDTLDMLAGKQWFSTLDLASGYWQVSLSRRPGLRQHLQHIWDYFNSKLCCSTRTAMVTLFSAPRLYHLVWHYLPRFPR